MWSEFLDIFQEIRTKVLLKDKFLDTFYVDKFFYNSSLNGPRPAERNQATSANANCNEAIEFLTWKRLSEFLVQISKNFLHSMKQIP